MKASTIAKIRGVPGAAVSYAVFIAWTLITVVPLAWMAYSSFKSNEELVLDIFAPPKALFDNMGDEYVVIPDSFSLRYPYDPKVDTRPRLIIESTTIAPTRRLFVHFLLKEELPPDIAALKPGDTLRVSQLPAAKRRAIDRKTIWFNYEAAASRGNLGAKFLNSIVYSAVSTTLIVVLGLMMGFALAKMGFGRISVALAGLIGFGYLISNNSVIIPLFLMLSKLGLTDTHAGMILVYTAFGLPLSVMLSSQFIKGLPGGLIESAFIDGAGWFRVMFSIIMPMSAPVITTIAIISALGIWNEFLLVLVIASSEATKSLPVGVFSFSSLQSTQLGWQLAALVIAALPVMVVYFIFNKRLTQGVVAGAVKG